MRGDRLDDHSFRPEHDEGKDEDARGAGAYEEDEREWDSLWLGLLRRWHRPYCSGARELLLVIRSNWHTSRGKQ